MIKKERFLNGLTIALSVVEKVQIGIENIIAHSNRGPDKIESRKDLRNPKPYPGGLTTVLAPLLSKGRGGTWVATTGSDFERKHFHDGNIERIPFNGGYINLTEALVGEKTYTDFYKGFSPGLWFLLHLTQPFHDMPHLVYPQPSIPEEKLPAYERVNRQHVNVAMRLIKDKEGFVILNPHDYHLMLYSQLANQEMVKQGIDPGKVLMFQFMHTPIPSAENLETLIEQGHFYGPSARNLFRGLLGNHGVFVQTEEFGTNLADIFERFGLEVDDQGDGFYVVRHDLPNQTTHIRPNPTGIDTVRVREAAMQNSSILNHRDYIMSSSSGKKRLYDLIDEYRKKGYLIGGSVERLDPTKGLIPRLDALDIAFEREIRDGNKIIYIGFWPSSRGGILDKTAEDRIKEINQKYRDVLGHDAIFYKLKPIYFPHNIVLMKELDFMTVTPLDDGRNLTADEFIIAQSVKPEEQRGFLVLGPCGTKRIYSSHEIDFDEGVVMVNTLDTYVTAQRIRRAIRQKPKINQRAIDVVEKYDVNGWFTRNLEYLGHATGKRIEVVY